MAFLRSRNCDYGRKAIAKGRYQYGFGIFVAIMIVYVFLGIAKISRCFVFRCSRYKPESPCNGRGFTVRGMFHVTDKHSHNNKRNGGLAFEVQKRLRKGGRLAFQLSTTPTETLASKVRHGASRLVRAHLPSKDSMGRRLRQNKLKEVLSSIDNDEMIVPDSARETLDGERFLFWDSREQEPESTTILIWMSKVPD